MPVPAGVGSDSALYDLLTLEEGYQAINVDEANASAELQAELPRYITAVSRIIDDRCGPVVQRTITAEPHDGGCGLILPRYVPVASVTTVEEYSGTTLVTLTAESTSSQVADQYFLHSNDLDVRLYRRNSGGDGCFAPGRGNILITYVAGRYDDTYTVDMQFKAAAESILRRLMKREGGAWSQNPTQAFGTDVGTIGFFNAVNAVINEQLTYHRLPQGVG